MHHTTLDVWQRSMDLVIEIYKTTSTLPREETYGLQSQMRRAATSIPSNIAEGEGRKYPRDRAQFFNIARGSLYELHTQITICRRLGYMTEETEASLLNDATRVAMLINGTLRSLNRRT